MAEQSNPGRKALSFGVAAGIIGIALGVYASSGEKVDSVNTRIPASDGNVEKLTEEAKRIDAHLKKARELKDLAPEGAMAGSVPRLTPLFFSPEVWQVSLDRDKKNVMIDIYDPAAEYIHAGIPNTWFIDNRISEALGQSNGPEMDSDGDGFTNREEFEAKTAPNDGKVYPNLLSKLQAKGSVTSSAIVTTDSMLAYETQPPAGVNIRIFKKMADISPSAKYAELPVGRKFGLESADGKRFIVKGFKLQKYIGVGGDEVDEMALILTDTEAVGGSKDYIIRAGKPRPGDKKKAPTNVKGLEISDTVVTLKVAAGSEMGKDKAQFKVALGDTFTIPGGKGVKYTLENVNGDGSVVIRKEGAESPVSVPSVKD